MFKFGPAQCCCGCPRWEDRFEREDASELGDPWSVVTGSWELADGKAAALSANAYVRNSDPVYLLADTFSVEARARGSAGDQLRLVYYGRATTGEYSALEVTIGTGGAGYVRLVHVSAAGVRTVVREAPAELAADVDHALKVCWQSRSVPLATAIVDGTVYVADFEHDGDLTQLRIGLATGTVSASAAFDDVQFAELFDFAGAANACPVCGECCWPVGRPPDQVKVTIEDVPERDSVEDCSDCTALEGTYWLDRVRVDEPWTCVNPWTLGTGCVCYELELDLPGCGADLLTLCVRSNGGNCEINLNAVKTDGNLQILEYTRLIGSFDPAVGAKRDAVELERRLGPLRCQWLNPDTGMDEPRVTVEVE